MTHVIDRFIFSKGKEVKKMNETGNNKYSKDFKVPEGFDEILRNLTREILRNQPADINKFGYALRGDTVTLKYCNIDKTTFTFWNTWEYAFQTYANPFASPVTVIGNVSNGALGAFCGYATAYKTIIIPE